MNGVEALILAGGLGSRLREAVADRQNAAAQVHGRPFLSFLLARLEASGVRHAVLCTGYPWESSEALGDAWGAMRLSYSREERPLGTAGALRNAAGLTSSETILVANGDSLCLADPGRLLEVHDARRSAVTLLAVEMDDARRYGRVRLDGDGVVLAFEEGAGPGPGVVNAGVCAISRGVLADLPEGRPISLEREVLPGLVGHGLSALVVRCPFLDIETPEGCAEAERSLSGETLPWDGRPFVALDRDGTLVVERNYLSRAADVELVPGAGEALRSLAAAGFGLVVVTNQSGVGRGYFGLDALEEVNGRLVELLAQEGARLDGIYACPHAPDDGCGCRKPRGGLLRKAGHELGFEPEKAIVIGDNEGDVGLGNAVGATTILVRTGYGAAVESSGIARPAHTVADLPAAATLVLAGLPRRNGPEEERT